MYDRIVVPTDGSEVAETAATAAIALAGRFDADLHAIHVLEPGELSTAADDRIEEQSRWGEEAIAAVEKRAESAGLDTTTALLEGDSGTPTHRTLLDYTRDCGADLIVMGTHGHTGWDRFVLGSVTERTLRESPVPVLTVRGDTPFRLSPGTGSTGERYAGAEATIDRLLVPLDGSEGSGAALDHAVDLANATGADLHLLHVVDVSVAATGSTSLVLTKMEETAERLLGEAVAEAEAAGVSNVEPEHVRGTPYRTIVERANDHGVDCIVMGTHGRTGVQRYLLGSVTERTVRLAERPVLSVHAPTDGD